MILFSLILKHSHSFRQSGTCIYTTVGTGSLKMYIDSTQVTVVDFIILQSTHHPLQGRIVHSLHWCHATSNGR